MKILFQGDSITGTGRNREDERHLGYGYARDVKRILNAEPNDYEFINKGISGNRVTDLISRWKKDCLNIKPDFISILIGVNDVWHEYDGENGVDAESYEMFYDLLIKRTLEKLPGVKVMILIPYLLPGCGWEEYGAEFKDEVVKRGEAAKRIAEKYNLPYIELQNGLDKYIEENPGAVLSGDGVHPNNEGHKVIAKMWVEKFKEII